MRGVEGGGRGVLCVEGEGVLCVQGRGGECCCGCNASLDARHDSAQHLLCAALLLLRRYGVGMAVGFAAVVILKRAVRSLPVLGGVAKPLLGECWGMGGAWVVQCACAAC